MFSILYEALRSLILPLKEIDRVLPLKGKIVDLGCGEGILAKYLTRYQSRAVIGVDIDRKRLPTSPLKNLRFVCGDIREFNLKEADGIILSDVLHHLDYDSQKKLLVKIAAGLNKNGVLVVKEIDTQEFIRSRLSRFWDFIFYPKDKIYYFNSCNLKKILENLGFRVTITRPTRFFPGSTTLFVCQK